MPSLCGPAGTQLRSGGFEASKEGVSFLEAKNICLLHYCQCIIFYCLLKVAHLPRHSLLALAEPPSARLDG